MICFEVKYSKLLHRALLQSNIITKKEKEKKNNSGKKSEKGEVRSCSASEGA